MLDCLPVPKIGIVDIQLGSTLVTYTDGLCEVENHEKIEYGTDRIEDAIHNGKHSSMDELNNNLMNDVIEFKGDEPFVDDIAILSCYFL